MANRCAGLDPISWAQLPASGHCHSGPSSWLFPATAFETEALTCALRASMSPATTNASASSSYPTTPSSSSTSGGYDAPAPALRPTPPQARCLLGEPRAGRVTKRKPRPSRRLPPTYIMADPANFRRMVQEVTGFPVVASSGVRLHAAAARSWSPTPPPAACVLPTLDTSAFLFDRAVVAAPARGHDDGKSSSGGASPAVTATAVEKEDDGDSSVFLELEAMACTPPAFLADDFPTLESWAII
jgi:hypothetical protein